MAWSLRGSGQTGGSASSARAGTPAPTAALGGGTDIDRNVPVWDGRAQTLEQFEEDIELFCASCEDRQLTLLGPWIARAHAVGSKQRSVAMALTVETLRGKDGPQKILAAFKASLSDKPEGEVWTHVQKYVFGGQHQRFSSMAEYIVAEGVLHERALKSLRTAKRPAAADASAAASDADAAEVAQIESVFPEPLRAFLLLEKASLPGALRVSVLIQCNYVYDMPTVSTALRSALSEAELRRIDKRASDETFDQSGTPLGKITSN